MTELIHGVEVLRDSINRPWVRCPLCNLKIPAWDGSGKFRQPQWCRWCKKRIAALTNKEES